MRIIQQHRHWVGISFGENDLSEQSVVGSLSLKSLKMGGKIVLFDIRIQAIRSNGKLIGFGHVVSTQDSHPTMSTQELVSRVGKLLHRSGVNFQRVSSHADDIDVLTSKAQEAFA